MAIAPEPGKTKCPTCSSAMVPVGVSNEEVRPCSISTAQNVVISSNNPPERPRRPPAGRNAIIRRAVPNVPSAAMRFRFA